MRILLIAGGWSSEREVSLVGSQVVKDALLRLGHEVVFYDPLEPSEKESYSEPLTSLLKLAEESDFAFINLHGSPGEDGFIQAILERIGCPYQGSGPAGSFLALHKAAAKHVFRKSGLLTPDWEFLVSRPAAEWQTSLPYPLFVKSNTGGSSLYLQQVTDPEQLPAVLDEIFSSGSEVLIESMIKGKDVTCGILGEQALPPILIEPVSGDFFDYASKYKVGGAREICPAPLPEEILSKIQAYSLRAHTALGLSGYSRADFILTPSGEPYLLEVNTLPGMTATSLLPQAAKVAGIEFDQLIEKLIEFGLAASVAC